jgi:hypothetical protein
MRHPRHPDPTQPTTSPIPIPRRSAAIEARPRAQPAKAGTAHGHAQTKAKSAAAAIAKTAYPEGIAPPYDPRGAHAPAHTQRTQAARQAVRAARVHEPTAKTSTDTGAKPATQHALHFHHSALILLRLMLLLSMSLLLLMLSLLKLL